MNDKLTANDSLGASVIRGAGHVEAAEAHGFYRVECVGPDGVVKWTDVIENLVTTAGKNDLLTQYFLGSAFTAAVYMGLKGTGTASVSDIQATHAGWSEVGGANNPTYTGNRPTITMGAASGGSMSSPTTSFAITSSGTVAGCFINQGGSATKDNTTGVLYSAGDFTGGSKTVALGDTLNVTYTASV
jgi:hypothetical protein